MFRPWGNVDWIFSRLQEKEWGFLGCVSGEDRCLAAYELLQHSIGNSVFVRIFDQDPVDKERERKALGKRAVEAVSLGIPSSSITDSDLLSTADEIERYFESTVLDCQSLILDITSLPKRWFFLILRLALMESDLTNIVVTYSLGANYAKTISFNPEIPRALPGFAPLEERSECDVACIGVGYHASTILELFDVERPRDIKMLFPFPPDPPGIRKNWGFIRRIESVLKSNESAQLFEKRLVKHTHIGAIDASQNFDALLRITDAGKLTSLMAPYGPKPVSLAMCLFSLAAEQASLSEVPVYYSQPFRYSIDYTTGVSQQNGRSLSYAYPVRLNGRNLYAL